MIKEQIEVEIFIVDGHSLLSSDESEPRAQFEQERLHLPNDAVLRVALAVAIVQTQKVEFAVRGTFL